MTGCIHSYESFGAVDGPGIRFVVFFQGCPLRCRFCHNPDSWDAKGGTETSVDEIVEKILPYRAFFRRGGGVTLSGGEPLLQADFAYELLHALRAHGIHTALDTSGSVPLERCRRAVDEADMLLLDIKSIDPETCEAVTGSPTCLEREKALLDYCEQVGKPVWIRHVVVPGLTLNYDHLAALGDFLSRYRCVERIDPLPFHKMGEYKWRPGTYTLADTPTPTEEEMAEVRKLLCRDTRESRSA